MDNFRIESLDHVAIRVKDMAISIAWYEKVLGLKKYQLVKWGDFPIFMLAGKVGVALFPANLEDEEISLTSLNVKIDHFAFNVTNDNFLRARNKYETLGMDYHFQDHHYFHSIYTKDPDGHTVELTTLMVNEAEFYND
jgi:catechol 2,3-dioxygenase-like lactoylglutathione lyase family enzyme